MKIYVLRDIISLNKIQEFCKASPNLTIGQLLQAQLEAQKRMEEAIGTN